MPMIRSVDIQLDRIILTLTNGNVKTLFYSQIPQAVRNNGPAAVDAWVVAFADDPANDICFDPALPTARRFYVSAHTLSIDPTLIVIAISTTPLTGTWWKQPGT